MIGKETHDFTGFQLRTKNLASKYCNSLRCSVTCSPTLVRAKGQEILFFNPFTDVD